ncbi:MAG: hypothetical protein QOF00_3132 [Pseudonocardiales bacterium]|jgi:excisionase family DNA binding protein|nr:hypothetical protein [Pseudonocardiales bacterium]
MTPGARWLSVGEASRALGMSRTTLLAAEEAGLVAPMRTPGGHRRYSPTELHRYLEQAGGTATAAPATSPVPEAAGPAASLDVSEAVRDVVRPLVRALDADSGGVYLLHEDTHDGTGPRSLRFCASFGVPRWLTERLAAAEPPSIIAEVLDARHHRLFDAAATAFPEPRSTGQGLAVALRRWDRTLGTLFLVMPPGRVLLPGELRVVDAFRELIAVVVDDRLRIATLEHRLARIGGLARY